MSSLSHNSQLTTKMITIKFLQDDYYDRHYHNFTTCKWMNDIYKVYKRFVRRKSKNLVINSTYLTTHITRERENEAKRVLKTHRFVFCVCVHVNAYEPRPALIRIHWFTRTTFQPLIQPPFFLWCFICEYTSQLLP